MLIYSGKFFPTLFSMQTLLRTAMVGGAQAVWLLAPDDREERVANADQLSQETYWNQYMWATGITTTNPDIIDQQELAAMKRTLATLRGSQKRSEVSQLQLIKAAAEHVYSNPPDADAVSECVAEFRHTSSAAHALAWNLHTRAEKVDMEHEGHSGHLMLPSWTQLQGAMSEALRIPSHRLAIAGRAQRCISRVIPSPQRGLRATGCPDGRAPARGCVVPACPA